MSRVGRLARQVLATNLDLAHVTHDATTDPELSGAARTVNMLAIATRRHDPRDAQTIDDSPLAAWVTPRDLLANRAVSLPDHVRAGIAATANGLIDANGTAMSAAALLEAASPQAHQTRRNTERGANGRKALHDPTIISLSAARPGPALREVIGAANPQGPSGSTFELRAVHLGECSPSAEERLILDRPPAKPTDRTASRELGHRYRGSEAGPCRLAQVLSLHVHRLHGVHRVGVGCDHHFYLSARRCISMSHAHEDGHSHQHGHASHDGWEAMDEADPKAGPPSRRQLIKYGGVGATIAAASRPFPDARSPPTSLPAGPGAAGRAARGVPETTTSTPSTAAGSTPPRTRRPSPRARTRSTRSSPTPSWPRASASPGSMCTDHGGPTHSKVNLELAYPDLLKSRGLVPEVLQFWGMEFDAPQMDHHTLMIPQRNDEAQLLFDLESPVRQARRVPRRPVARHRGEDGRVPQLRQEHDRQAAGHRPPRRPLGDRARRLGTGHAARVPQQPGRRSGRVRRLRGRSGSPGGAAQRRPPRRLRQPPDPRRLRPDDRARRRPVGLAAR